MKLLLSAEHLPQDAILITCSSHESRCLGLFKLTKDWKPAGAVIFHYDDENPRREENHSVIVTELNMASVSPVILQFTEADAVKSLHDNMDKLHELLKDISDNPIVLDVSVFTKRHLLMMLRWLDDEGLWDRITIIYSEPKEYDVSQYIPLSFGLSSLQQIPGFTACPDLSRPVHLVLFLGYEGDRALAVYEHVQPMKTTLIIPYPPYNKAWEGRTEYLNADLISVVEEHSTEKVDSLDPDQTIIALKKIFHDDSSHSLGEYAKIVCPLGTKPQTLGIYSYLRECVDPPAVIYASPLRHNHTFGSHGIGNVWILKKANLI